MVDTLVRNVDEITASHLKKKAAAKGASLSKTEREALADYVKPDKAELWAEADALRRRSTRSLATRLPISARIATIKRAIGNVVVDAGVAVKWCRTNPTPRS
jgi:plasmid stability protein